MAVAMGERKLITVAVERLRYWREQYIPDKPKNLWFGCMYKQGYYEKTRHIDIPEESSENKKQANASGSKIRLRQLGHFPVYVVSARQPS
jgi:hypothetical protein